MERERRGILLFEYFWKEAGKKTLGIKRFEKNTQKENENNNNSNTGIADLALVRDLDRRIRSGGVDKKR